MASVGVHHDDRLPDGTVKSGDHRGSESQFSSPVHDHRRERGLQSPGVVRGPVGGTVVHDDQF